MRKTPKEYYFFVSKNQIADNRPNKGDDMAIPTKLLSFIYQTTDSSYHRLPSHASSSFYVSPYHLQRVCHQKQITKSMMMIGRSKYYHLCWKRKWKFWENSYGDVIEDHRTFRFIHLDWILPINEMSRWRGSIHGDINFKKKLQHKIERGKELMHKQEERPAEMGPMTEITQEHSIGCTLRVWYPLSQWRPGKHFQQKRDEEE